MKDRKLAVVVLASWAAIMQLHGSEVRRLTLPEAVQLAISQNRALKIARLKIAENQQKKAGAHSSYFPVLTNQSNALHITELQQVLIPAGGLGVVSSTLIPGETVNLNQGKETIFSSGTMLAQPITQLIRVHQQNRIAAEEVIISQHDEKKAENEVALQVHALYYEILITQLQKKAVEQQMQYADESLRESEDEIRQGSALKVAAIGGMAQVLEQRQAMLTADLHLSDLTAELNNVLGLPLDTRLELDAVPTGFEISTKAEYLRVAWSQSPEILAAEEKVTQARAVVKTARTAYIPEITAYARDSYQDGLPFLVHNFGEFGVHMSYDVFDFGKRRAAVRERQEQLAEAEQNVQRLKEDVAVSVERAYNKLERTKTMVDVAEQVVSLRQESERLTANELAQGIVHVSKRRQAIAASYKAQADLLQAGLGYLLAHAELEQTIGRTPGL